MVYDILCDFKLDINDDVTVLEETRIKLEKNIEKHIFGFGWIW